MAIKLVTQIYFYLRMFEQNTLLIDKSPKGTFILTSERQPVWPAQTNDEWQVLVQIAEVFAAQVEQVQGHLGYTESGTEVVVGLGEDVEEAARLYAHLTLRQFRVVASLKDLTDGALPAVIVTTLPWLSDELMEFLYLTEADFAPGIICASTPEALRQQVLIRSAATVLSGSVEIPQVDIFPILALERFTQPNREVFGGKAESFDLQLAMGCGAGVLTIMTHSDGVDAFLGSQLTLCPMIQPSVAADKSLSPRCQVTGICHRQLVSVEEALNSSALIAPEAISARILIWNVCLGLLLPKSVVDPAWGIGPRLLQSSTIGAVITTWEIVLTSPEHTESLSQDILRGIPVGKALAKFNASLNSRRQGNRMCLLGDPRLRLPKVNSNSQHKQQKILNIESVQPTLAEDIREVMLLRACMTEAVSRASGDLLPVAKEALEAIQVYEYAGWRGITVEGQPDAPGPAMRRSVLQYVFCRGKLLESWLPFARTYRSISSSTQCFVCGQRTNTLIVNFRIPKVSRRRISICPCCGVIEDAPIKSNITFSIFNKSIVKLEGSLPKEKWTVGLLLQSSLPSDYISLEWPTDSNGSPTKFINLPNVWPLGPTRVSVIVMWGGSFAIVSKMEQGNVE